MQTFYIKQGDEGSVLKAVLTDEAGPVDLTGATVTFTMGSGSEQISGSADPDPDQTANKGVVRYTFAALDVDTPGFFMAEFQVDFSGGGTSTYPRGVADEFILVIVQDDERGTSLSEGQLEDIREICQLQSLEYTRTLCARLVDAQLAKLAIMLADEWPDLRHDDVRITGRVQIDPEKTRELFTRDVRLMLGLTPDPLMDQLAFESGSSRTRVQF